MRKVQISFVIRGAVAVVWPVLWCVSLTMPVIDGYLGSNVLMWGWAGILGLQPGWFANLTFPGVSLLPLFRDVSALVKVILAVAQLALAIGSLFWSYVPDSMGVIYIDGFKPGFYLWVGVMVGSAVFLLFTTLMDEMSNRARKSAGSGGRSPP